MTDEKFLAEVGHVLLSMDCDCDEVPAGDVHCPAHRLARIIKIIEDKNEILEISKRERRKLVAEIDFLDRQLTCAEKILSEEDDDE